MKNEKELGKLTREQLKSFYAHFAGSQQDATEFKALSKENEDVIKNILSKSVAWGAFYSMPYLHFIYLFFRRWECGKK